MEILIKVGPPIIKLLFTVISIQKKVVWSALIEYVSIFLQSVSKRIIIDFLPFFNISCYATIYLYTQYVKITIFLLQ